jgi:hypothetical protein
VVAWGGGQWRPVSEAGFDHEQLAVFVWRAERAGGDTKTPRTRRTLALPRKCVEALREHRGRRAGWRLGRCGRITAWCSLLPWGRRRMITTCGGSSG